MNPPTEKTWQQALDAKLVQRLWQRAERPGLSRLQQSRALLARHQSVVGRSSLTERLQQRAGVAEEASLGLVPIVYALPQQTSITPGEVGSQPTVVQRVVTPTAQAAPSLMPVERGVPVSASTLLILNDRHMTRNAQDTPLPLDQPAATELPVVTAVRVADLTSATGQLPLVLATPMLSSFGSTLHSVVPTASGLWPIALDKASDRGSSADRVIVPWSPGPTAKALDVYNVPVVHEQVTRERMPGANMLMATSLAQLPLAAVAAPSSQPTAGPSVSDERQVLTWRRSANNTSQSTLAEPAADRAATKRSAQNEIDIDQISDRVQRKFVQQLAIERERRGLR